MIMGISKSPKISEFGIVIAFFSGGVKTVKKDGLFEVPYMICPTKEIVHHEEAFILL